MLLRRAEELYCLKDRKNLAVYEKFVNFTKTS